MGSMWSSWQQQLHLMHCLLLPMHWRTAGMLVLCCLQRTRVAMGKWQAGICIPFMELVAPVLPQLGFPQIGKGVVAPLVTYVAEVSRQTQH
jgi:hypothetical protein